MTTALCYLTTAGEDSLFQPRWGVCCCQCEQINCVSVTAVRIQPLSDALGDLYKEFNTLKERLAELTAKFDGVEAFVDEVRSGRKPAAPRGEARPPGSLPGETEAAATDAGRRPQGRRTRVVVRRIKIPAGSQV